MGLGHAGQTGWPNISTATSRLCGARTRGHRRAQTSARWTFLLGLFCPDLQHQVGLAKPQRLDSRKLAIRNAAHNMLFAMTQAGVGSFPPRLKLRIRAEGRQFSHVLERPELLHLDFDLAATRVAGLMDEEGEEDYRPDDQSTEKQN